MIPGVRLATPLRKFSCLLAFYFGLYLTIMALVFFSFLFFCLAFHSSVLYAEYLG